MNSQILKILKILKILFIPVHSCSFLFRTADITIAQLHPMNLSISPILAATTQPKIDTLDVVIIIAYLMGIVGIGLYAGMVMKKRKRKMAAEKVAIISSLAALSNGR